MLIIHSDYFNLFMVVVDVFDLGPLLAYGLMFAVAGVALLVDAGHDAAGLTGEAWRVEVDAHVCIGAGLLCVCMHICSIPW